METTHEQTTTAPHTDYADASITRVTAENSIEYAFRDLGDKQLGVVKELTEIVAAAARDPSLRERTWVLLSESLEVGWGIAGTPTRAPTSPRWLGRHSAAQERERIPLHADRSDEE